MKTKLKELLNAREERDKKEKKLLLDNLNSTLVTIGANYVGENKNTIYSHLISYLNFLQVQKKIKAKKILHSLTAEGLLFFVITNENALSVKQKTIAIEEKFFLGRLADIDVRTIDNQQIEKNYSRSDLKLPRRKCLICNKPAVICVRNRTHSPEEIIQKTIFTTELFFIRENKKQNLLSNIIRTSMLEELCRKYPLGCVNVNSTGSHNDMNFLLMLKGIDIICEMIKKLKHKHTKDFYSLRAFGFMYEQKLFKVCNGVNTYKGALFILLILSASVLRTKNFEELSTFIAELSYPCIYDLSLEERKKDLKYLGIRGEVISGLKNHFKIFLPFLEEGVSNEELTLKILQHTYDTTTIKRGGIEKLKHIQKKAGQIKNETELKELNDYCIKNNLSTGGVADNFIVTYALFLIKKYLYRV
ncbi:MAG: citrate lyase holo-[acyl-carrier protein] synthase [Treponemataceae bacterium]